MICENACKEIACAADCHGWRYQERVAYYPGEDASEYGPIPAGIVVLGVVVRGSGRRGAWVRTESGFEMEFSRGGFTSLPERRSPR